MEQNRVQKETHTYMVNWFYTNGSKGNSVEKGQSVPQMAQEKLNISIQISGL